MDKVGKCRHQHRTDQYLCNKCRKFFHLRSMYACFHGHYMCRSCYRKSNTESIYNIDDNISDTTEEPRAPTANHLAQSSPFLARDAELGEILDKKRVMFPNPSVYHQKTIDKHGSLISLATIYKPSLLNMYCCSKKPIVCPQYDCRKTIAVSSLDAHFHHEHKQVATVVTQLETRNCLEFNFKDLRGKNRNMCLALFSLENPGEFFTSTEEEHLQGSSRTSRVSQPLVQPFFILVVAKMTHGPQDEKLNGYNSEYQPNERVFFYVTSNIIAHYSYTIAVSTPIQSIRVKYFGPLLSVNEDFRKLCDDGKGLILNHHHINGMSDDCGIPVNIDLILHEREEEALAVQNY